MTPQQTIAKGRQRSKHPQDRFPRMPRVKGKTKTYKATPEDMKRMERPSVESQLTPAERDRRR